VNTLFRSLSFGLLLLLAPPAPARAAPAGNDDCLGCHSDASLTVERRGRPLSLHVDPKALASSTHADLSCTDCHTGFRADAMPHRPRIMPVNCAACHAGAPGAHRFHTAFAHARGRDDTPARSCKGCHGTHAVAALKAADSPWQPARQPESCGRCHAEVAKRFDASAHGRSLATGAAGAPACVACHDRPITTGRAGGATAEHKIEQEKLCLKCHLDDPGVRGRVALSAGFIAAYEKSVHGSALLKGNAAAANCVDCHGAHDMEKGFEPTARVHRMRIPETCGACHGDVAQVYGHSVHGRALASGKTEAPVCTDCHGEHDIMDPADPRSPVAPANVSARVCSPCHSSVRLSEKYGIRADRFQTFQDSFHGLAIRGGDVAVANCASCHGAHDIRASADPESRVHKANLAATCGECHPGATERFATGTVHVAMTRAEEPVLYWIALIYVILIVLVVGGMLAHNALDFLRKAYHRIQVRRGRIAEPPAGRALYVRMTLNERLQHGSLMLSFTVLVITGFMLSYPDSWWVAGLRRISSRTFEMRSLLHRIAAAVMTVASVYHIGYLALTQRGRRLFLDLLPRPSDVTGAFAAVTYNLGLRRERPRFGRFGYVEKAEYWALVWGTVVMAVTGVILWFEDASIGLVTKLGWDISRTVHFYEAWLATLAILVWHLYFVIFNPEAYPMNMAWLTGTLSEEEMAAEHPLELEAIRGRGAGAARAGADGATAQGGAGDASKRGGDAGRNG
jgi:cytochrome b subunit of formate dehydrogenase